MVLGVTSGQSGSAHVKPLASTSGLNSTIASAHRQNRVLDPFQDSVGNRADLGLSGEPHVRSIGLSLTI